MLTAVESKFFACAMFKFIAAPSTSAAPLQLQVLQGTKPGTEHGYLLRVLGVQSRPSLQVQSVRRLRWVTEYLKRTRLSNNT